jgi:hypothetical protein
MEYDIGILQSPQSAQRQEIGIARPSAHQMDNAGLLGAPVAARPPKISAVAAKFCFRTVSAPGKREGGLRDVQNYRKETHCSLFAIDENRFLYSNTNDASNRKIFFCKRGPLWDKLVSKRDLTTSFFSRLITAAA